MNKQLNICCTWFTAHSTARKPLASLVIQPHWCKNVRGSKEMWVWSKIARASCAAIFWPLQRYTCSYKGWSYLFLLYCHPRPGSKQSSCKIGDDQAIKTSFVLLKSRSIWILSFDSTHTPPTPGWQLRVKAFLPVRSSDQGPKMPPIKFWSRSRVSVQQVYMWPPLVLRLWIQDCLDLSP